MKISDFRFQIENQRWQLRDLQSEYHWSWAYFVAACVFVPAFAAGALLKGTIFDYIFGFILAVAWALHLVRPFVLRRKLLRQQSAIFHLQSAIS